MSGKANNKPALFWGAARCSDSVKHSRELADNRSSAALDFHNPRWGTLLSSSFSLAANVGEEKANPNGSWGILGNMGLQPANQSVFSRLCGRWCVFAASRCTRIVSYLFIFLKFQVCEKSQRAFLRSYTWGGFHFLFFYSFTQKDHTSSGPFTHAAQYRPWRTGLGGRDVPGELVGLRRFEGAAAGRCPLQDESALRCV